MLEEEYFNEYENGEIVAEITHIAKGLLKKEITEKINYLEEKNKKLEEDLWTLRNFADEKLRLESKIKSLEREKTLEYQKGFDDCKAQRLTKLLDLQTGFGVSWEEDYATAKCDKCDDKRMIHFKSPSGNELTEKCSCARTIKKFKVDPVPVQLWIFGYEGEYNRPARYYKHPEVKEFGQIREEFDLSKIWVPACDATITFDKIPERDRRFAYSRYIFESKEECQKYVDWLNENYYK